MNEFVLYPLLALGVPLVFAAAGTVMAPKRPEHAGTTSWRTVGVAACLALPPIIARFASVGVPNESQDVIVYMPMIALGGVLALRFLPRAWWAFALVTALVAGGCLWAGWAFVRPEDSWVNRLMPAGLILVLALGVEPTLRRFRDVWTGAALTIGMMGAVAVSGIGGYIAGTVALASMAFALAGIVCGTALRRRSDLSGGLILILATGPAWFAFVSWINCIFADPARMPIWTFLLPALSPLGLWIGAVPKLAKGKPWIRGLVQILAVLILAGIGIAGAVFQFGSAPSEDDPYGGYGDWSMVVR